MKFGLCHEGETENIRAQTAKENIYLLLIYLLETKLP